MNTYGTEIEQARFNMIEQQIRTWEVLDATVLDLLKKVPREQFVPPQYAGLAFADMEIPMGEGQIMLSPKLEARMLQALHLKPTDKVLEIGTGSGYMTALLAHLADSVLSVEIHPSLSHAAASKLQQMQINNVELLVGDAQDGWQTRAPFDVIVFTGAHAIAPQAVTQQLAIGGRMLSVVGESTVMQAVLSTKRDNLIVSSEILFETHIPYLTNIQRPSQFSF